MKYGLLVEFGAKCSNYGDYIQSIAIEYLYELMGVDSQDIVHITSKDLGSYEGETLLLPYSYVMHLFVFPEYRYIKLSKNIIPIFLGGSFSFTQFGQRYPLKNILSNTKSMQQENPLTWFEMFKKFAPIGCRDEFTKKFLVTHGIPAYLQGCITNILPCRTAGKHDKILLIDCTDEILPYIPEELYDDIEVMTNYVPNGDLSIEANYRRIKLRYKYYSDTAKLIVTSRYHVATPCNAMGIPCVFIPRKINYYIKDIRLDTLHPQIQFIDNGMYEQIKWDLEWHDFKELKSSIIRLATARIQEVYMRYSKTERIGRIYNYKKC